MNCDTARGAMVALLDGEVTADEGREVEAHLRACAGCARELALLRETRALVARHLGRPASSGSFDALWERAAAGEVTTDGRGDRRSARRTGGRGAGTPARGTRARRLAPWLGAGGLAAAAALVLALYHDTRPGGQPSPLAQRGDPLVVAEAGRAAPPAGPATVLEQGPAEGRTGEAPRPEQRLAAAEPARPPRGASRAAAPAAARLARSPGETLVVEEGAEPGAVALNEPDPPRDLLQRPDLFVNYSIVQKLDELQHLEAVMARPARTGGAG